MTAEKVLAGVLTFTVMMLFGSLVYSTFASDPNYSVAEVSLPAASSSSEILNSINSYTDKLNSFSLNPVGFFLAVSGVVDLVKLFVIDAPLYVYDASVSILASYGLPSFLASFVFGIVSLYLIWEAVKLLRGVGGV